MLVAWYGGRICFAFAQHVFLYCILINCWCNWLQALPAVFFIMSDCAAAWGGKSWRLNRATSTFGQSRVWGGDNHIRPELCFFARNGLVLSLLEITSNRPALLFIRELAAVGVDFTQECSCVKFFHLQSFFFVRSPGLFCKLLQAHIDVLFPL